MAELNYDEDMQIDPNALDVEWLNQASLALKYCRHVAMLHDKQRRAEERKKSTRSALILAANDDPKGTIGKDKPNANDIEAYYRNHSSYKAVIVELNEIMEEVEYAELAKNEICYTRKAALENLVTLHGQQYFAGPSVPRNLSKEWENKQKQRRVDAGIAAAMHRTRTTEE